MPINLNILVIPSMTDFGSCPYLAADEHLFGDNLNALLELRLAIRRAHRVNICQVRLEKLEVAAVRQASILVFSYLEGY